jgi:hypothetical protein
MKTSNNMLRHNMGTMALCNAVRRAAGQHLAPATPSHPIEGELAHREQVAVATVSVHAHANTLKTTTHARDTRTHMRKRRTFHALHLERSQPRTAALGGTRASRRPPSLAVLASTRSCVRAWQPTGGHGEPDAPQRSSRARARSGQPAHCDPLSSSGRGGLAAATSAKLFGAVSFRMLAWLGPRGGPGGVGG